MNPTKLDLTSEAATVLASWRHDWEDKGSPWHYCADHWLMLHDKYPSCSECGALVDREDKP